MAKVVLIHPWNFHEEGVVYTEEQLKHYWRTPPVGIVLLATELRNKGHDVIICDLERDIVVNNGNLEITLKQMCELLLNIHPNYVGISVISSRYLEAKRIIGLCDEIRKGMKYPFKLALGNIHPTCEPEITLKDNPEIDAVFLGEADESFIRWVNGENIEQIPGVAFRKDNEIIIKPGYIVSNLDTLPFPDWSFLDTKFYSAPNFAKHGRKIIPARSLDIITSRGCPYRCTFCAYNMMKFRWNNPDYVIKNIEYLLNNFDIDSSYILDSSIGNNRRQLIGICEGLIKRGLHQRFRWVANMRADQVNEEILKLMWKAGCTKLFYGFESGSQRILDAMKKRCTVEQNTFAAKLHSKLGFPYHASIIVGFPEETVEDLEMTLRWLEQLRSPLVGINSYVPLPGSEDYIKLKSINRIKVEDPKIWRSIGESNIQTNLIFCNVPQEIFLHYFEEMKALATEFNKSYNEKYATL